MADKILDLGQLEKRSAGRVRLRDGAEHDVLQLTGRMYQRLRASTTQTATDEIYALAADVVPSATPEQISGLTLEEANAILALAAGGIAAIEQLYPNAVSPAASTSPG